MGHGLPFIESKVAYVDGQYVPVEDAMVSVFDRGFLYGDGIYETLRVHKGRVFRLDDHLARLERSAAVTRLALPLDASDLRTTVLETVRRNGFSDAYVRVIVSRGVSFPVLDTRAATYGSTLVVLVHSLKQPSDVASFFEGDGLRVQIVSIRKTPSIALDPRAKTLNYLNQILARLEATSAGADEALLLDIHGFVAEGAGDNVFVVHGTELVTPPPQEILGGITRETVMNIARDLGLSVVERNMTPYDLYTADEAFASSTYGGILPIAEVNNSRVGRGTLPGPVTESLFSKYQELLEAASEAAPDLEGASSGS
jgi:branched-chain amino acid aminotransferase